MDDDMEIGIPDLADALKVKPATVRGWMRPRKQGSPKLESYVPFGNRRMGRKTTAGDVRQFLALLEEDRGHALKRFEAWCAEQRRA